MDIGLPGGQSNGPLVNQSGYDNMSRVLEVVRHPVFDEQYFFTEFFGNHYTVSLRPQPVQVQPYVPVDELADFQCYLDSGNSVRALGGYFNLVGIGQFPVAGKTIILTGEFDYVFAFYTYGNNIVGIDHQASLPVSDTNTIRVPLTRWDLIGAGSYKLGATMHKYDITMGNPLR